MTVNGKLTGMSTEVVQALLDEAGVEAAIQSMPWARAYDIALNNPNVMIYSITPTPDRERLFKWVGTVAQSRWYLYSAANRGIQLRTLDDARNYQIATVKEDVGEQYLIAKGFQLGSGLQSSTRYGLNYQKLQQGRVDLWISNELNARYLARESQDNPQLTLKPALSLPDLGGDEGLKIAFSRTTPDATVEHFRRALQRIKDNGVYADIAKRWM
jgi:polar amino acid transport system substrate-binding protein